MLRVSYKDRLGQLYQDYDVLKIEEHSQDFFENKSIRKAVLLTRYVSFFKNYLSDVRNNRESNPSMSISTGISIPQVPQEVSCDWCKLTCAEPLACTLHEAVDARISTPV